VREGKHTFEKEKIRKQDKRNRFAPKTKPPRRAPTAEKHKEKGIVGREGGRENILFVRLRLPSGKEGRMKPSRPGIMGGGGKRKRGELNLLGTWVT